MSSRKEQKEALRREREAREQAAKAAQRRKQLVGYGVGGALALAAVVIVVVVLAAGGGDGGPNGEGNAFPSGGKVEDPGPLSADVEAAADAAGCELKSNKVDDPLPDGSYHLQSETDSGNHKQNPPTSGLHNPIPADDGLYQEAPTDEQLVHSLEHGRVIIWAKPSLPKEDRAALRALFEQDDLQMILVPRANMPYAVAATAWNGDPKPTGVGRLMGCPRFDDKVVDALRAFRDEHRARGPEPVP